jgi:DNA-binding IscR family transcriptional regulator
LGLIIKKDYNGDSLIIPILICSIMPEGLTDPAEKVFKAMLHAGLVSEEKMKDAQGITNMSKIPKAQCMNALQELEKKGFVKRKSRDKSAGYFLCKTS